MTRYVGLHQALALDFAFGRCFFLPLGKKRELIMLFWRTAGHFWCPVVTLITFSSNLSNFQKNPFFLFTKKNNIKSQKIAKNELKKNAKIYKL